jgi:hypothetical protein
MRNAKCSPTDASTNPNPLSPLPRPHLTSFPPPSCSPRWLQELVKSGKVLDKVGEKTYLDTLSTEDSIIGVLTVELLSTHADNEAYLGDPNHLYILASPLCCTPDHQFTKHDGDHDHSSPVCLTPLPKI